MDSESLTSSQLRRQVLLFFFTVATMAMAMGVHDSILNNFLADDFQMDAATRGWLECPREIPGFLVVFFIGLLYAMPVTRVGMVGSFIFLIGMIGMFAISGTLTLLVIVMMIASVGQHLTMPVSASIVLATSDARTRGFRMGQTRAIETIGMMLGCGLVFLLFKATGGDYRQWFLVAGLIGGVGGIAYGMMHIPHLNRPRPKLVLKRKFTLYYLLEFVFGARKQVFLTFGPWVLIQVYGYDAPQVAKLLLIAAGVGIVFKPLAGIAIDRFGERIVMLIDATVLIFVCLGYGYAKSFGEQATLMAGRCYILDNLMFALSSARSTYVARLSNDHQEIASTLAMGTSVNHIASMAIPVIAGALWLTVGYRNLFVAAAGVSVISGILAMWVPARAARHDAPH